MGQPEGLAAVPASEALAAGTVAVLHDVDGAAERTDGGRMPLGEKLLAGFGGGADCFGGFGGGTGPREEIALLFRGKIGEELAEDGELGGHEFHAHVIQREGEKSGKINTLLKQSHVYNPFYRLFLAAQTDW